MAHYVERHLKDEKSEEFLKSKGFVLVPSTSGSQWLSHTVTLFLKEDSQIRCDYELHKFIYDMAYADGKEEGKTEAISAIQRMIFQTVFPPELKNVEDEPTYA